MPAGCPGVTVVWLDPLELRDSPLLGLRNGLFIFWGKEGSECPSERNRVNGV